MTQPPSTVLHVLGWGLPRGTAQRRIVAGLAKKLDPDRYRLRAWFISGAGPIADQLAELGVEWRLVPYRGAKHPVDVVTAIRALRVDRPAIAHLHVGGRSLAWLVRAASSARVVAHLHGSHNEEGGLVPVESFARSANAVIAASSYVAQRAVVPATVIGGAVELPPAGTVRNVPTGPPVVGSAARLAPIKGHDQLLYALRILRDRGIEVNLELAGCGPSESRLRALSLRLGLDTNVTFLGWQRDVAALHRRWHVFALPSHHEGFCLAALEAMASGLPVVASDVDALPELVEHGRTGYLVPPGNAEALAGRLAELLLDDQARQRMGSAGRRRAGDFSIKEMADRTSVVYDRLLRSSSGD